MAYSKVIVNGTTVMDITQDTVVADKLYQDYTAHDASGEQITGTATGGSVIQEPDPLDVDFIDYDGTLLYTYTASDFLNLSELPANPTHSGLVAQGWNWTLADAKEFVGKYGCLVIGQSYTTDNGRTKIYIHVPEEPNDFRTIQIVMTATVKNGVKIYWGDNTEELWNKNAGTNTSISHTYSNNGDYLIELEVIDGAISFLGRTGANNSLVGDDLRVCQWVKKIEIGNNVTGLAQNPFGCLKHLQTISMPTTLITLNDYDEVAFPRSLKAIVFPMNFTTSRYRAMFESYSSTRYISIPKGMNNLHINTYQHSLRKLTMYSLEPYKGTSSTIRLYDCPSLTHFVVMGTYTTIVDDTIRASAVKKIFIPASVTTINGVTTFADNSLEEIHLYPVTPPTLSNIGAFRGLKENAIFYVPYSADHSILEAYQTATNWSTYASQMQEEPQS